MPRDQPDNDTTSATLKVGGAARAAIDFANDSDWFKVEVKAGHTYAVDVEGVATLAGSLGDPRVVLDDKAGLDYENYLANGGLGRLERFTHVSFARDFRCRNGIGTRRSG